MTGRPDTWMKMYWGDYARDTGHLSAAGHGAYLMLIKHYWCTGKPLADDNDELWRISCCDSKRDWMKLRPKIIRLFYHEGPLLRHKRIDFELSEAATNSETRRLAGKKGADIRWQKDANATNMPIANEWPGDGLAIAEPPFCQWQNDRASESDKKKERKSVLRTDAEGVPEVTARDRLWGEGLPILRGLTGLPDGKARASLGRLLKEARDDCALALGVLTVAADLRPVDPFPWLIQAVRARSNDGRGLGDDLAREFNFSIDDLPSETMNGSIAHGGPPNPRPQLADPTAPPDPRHVRGRDP